MWGRQFGRNWGPNLVHQIGLVASVWEFKKNVLMSSVWKFQKLQKYAILALVWEFQKFYEKMC